MDISEALRITQCLADGIDPVTGEIFPVDSPYQHPQIIRALFTVIRAAEQTAQRQRRKRELPENAGKPWTDDEDRMRCEGFDAGLNIGQLSKRHKRTRGAIQARLIKLEKISPDNPSISTPWTSSRRGSDV